MIVKNSLFKPIYTNTDKRYIVLTGGRGSGKSFQMSTFLTELTYEQLQRILFTRWTMKSAEISIIPEFKEKLILLECGAAFNVNKTEIHNRLTKSDILFRGIKTSSGDQTANLKSINGITCWVVDEAEEFVDEEKFDTIDLSIRTKAAQNRVVLIMNPTDKGHWAYKKWFVNNTRIEEVDGYPVEICTHPDVLHLHTTYLDNLGNLSQSFIDNVQKLKISNPKMYGIKVIGQYTDIAEGAIFPKSELKRYKDDKYNYEGAVAYIDVSDEGTDFTCMFVGKIIDFQIHIVDIVFSDANTDTTIPMCAAALKRHNVPYCRVESNSMGAMFSRNLQKLLPSTRCLPANSTTHKHTRIYMDSVFINNYFYFKKDPPAMYEGALNQMGLYTKDGKAKHDDVADTASGLSIFLRAMFKKFL